jgi:hypothetical protein
MWGHVLDRAGSQFNRIRIKQILKILSCVQTKSDAGLKPNLYNSRWLQADFKELSIVLQAMEQKNVLKSYLTKLGIKCSLKRKTFQIKHVLSTNNIDNRLDAKITVY